MSQQSPSVESIFLAAVEIESAQQRAAYLDQACAGNPELKGRVEKLLDAHFRLGAVSAVPESGSRNGGGPLG